jgi:DNA replication protein DnaC
MSYLTRDLGRRYAPEVCSFDTYRVCHPGSGQRAVVDALRALAARLPESVSQGENLILAGTVGTGKDHLLAALLYSAASILRPALSCRHTTGEALYSEFRSTMRRDGDSERTVLDRCLTPKILGISDPYIASTPLSAWELGRLFAVVDGRSQQGWPTWVTANALTEEQLEEQLTTPVYDRLRDRALILWFDWPSYRTPRTSPTAPAKRGCAG